MVTRGNELVALEAGQVKWKKALGARVSTAPLVAGGRVFVLGVDRAVQAFERADGAKLWRLQRPGDPLALAQAGVIAAFKDTLVVGQGPRMAGIDPNSSTIRWEVTVGSPRGANEVERLADLVGPALRIGDMLCARSFQAAVGCVDADRGRILWTKHDRRHRAVAGDAELVFGADASDRITAWQDAERRRRLDVRSGDEPRRRRARAWSARRSWSATATATCTGSVAPRARRSCARPPTATRSRCRRSWSATR